MSGPLHCYIANSPGYGMMVPVDHHTEVTYDVAAADGMIIATDADAKLRDLIAGCVDGGPALVRVHPKGGGQHPAVWAYQMAARVPH